MKVAAPLCLISNSRKTIIALGSSQFLVAIIFLW
jgi:hypothetical protein